MNDAYHDLSKVFRRWEDARPDGWRLWCEEEQSKAAAAWRLEREKKATAKRDRRWDSILADYDAKERAAKANKAEQARKDAEAEKARKDAKVEQARKDAKAEKARIQAEWNENRRQAEAELARRHAQEPARRHAQEPAEAKAKAKPRQAHRDAEAAKPKAGPKPADKGTEERRRKTAAARSDADASKTPAEIFARITRPPEAFMRSQSENAGKNQADDRTKAKGEAARGEKRWSTQLVAKSPGEATNGRENSTNGRGNSTNGRENSTNGRENNTNGKANNTHGTGQGKDDPDETPTRWWVPITRWWVPITRRANIEQQRSLKVLMGVVVVHGCPPDALTWHVCRAFRPFQPGAIYQCQVLDGTARFEFFDSDSAKRFVHVINKRGIKIGDKQITTARLDMTNKEIPSTTRFSRVVGFSGEQGSTWGRYCQLSTMMELFKKHGFQPRIEGKEESDVATGKPLKVWFNSVKDADHAIKIMKSHYPEITVVAHEDDMGPLPRALLKARGRRAQAYCDEMGRSAAHVAGPGGDQLARHGINIGKKRPMVLKTNTTLGAQLGSATLVVLVIWVLWDRYESHQLREARAHDEQDLQELARGNEAYRLTVGEAILIWDRSESQLPKDQELNHQATGAGSGSAKP